MFVEKYHFKNCYKYVGNKTTFQLQGPKACLPFLFVLTGVTYHSVYQDHRTVYVEIRVQAGLDSQSFAIPVLKH